MTEPMIIHNIIEKETINTMPLVSFEGRIKVVDNLWDIEKAAISLEKCSIIGIDTETRPSFRKGEVHLVSLLQLATDEVSYLFRLNKVGLTPSIVRLLENPKLLKIGLSLKDDFLMLKKRASFNPEGYIELQEYVSAFGIEEKSLQKIYAILFGEKISKGQRLSNWDAEQLTIAQQEYAAIDAWACLKIYHKLEELKQSGDFVILKVNEEEICTESI